MSGHDVLFLGAKEIGARCLRFLIASRATLGIARLRVVAGRTRRGGDERHDIAAIAQAHGIEVAAALPSAWRARHMISVQYHAVLSAAELAQADGERINLHMAPLPEYRGANQFTFAIINGEREFGATLHRMEPRVDAGPVYAETRFAVAADETVASLYARTVEASDALFRREIGAILAGTRIPAAQDSLRPDRPRRFHRKRDVEGLKRLDPSWPLDKLDRYVRALDMPGYEPAYFEHDGRRIYLTTRYDASPAS